MVQLTKCLYFWKNEITIALSGILKELMQDLVWNEIFLSNTSPSTQFYSASLYISSAFGLSSSNALGSSSKAVQPLKMANELCDAGLGFLLTLCSEINTDLSNFETC